MTWETVIGLEVHAQLSTRSKLFSNSPTAYGAPPNTQTSYIDAGLPGVLPVLNQRAIQMAIQFGLSIHAQINQNSFFERKNYFYPDLPKGYQISQLQMPIVGHGFLDIVLPDGTEKRVNINRAHLEEDAGKSIHDTHSNLSRIDLNRAGTPLLEIVTTPCLYSAEEVVCYLKTLHQLLRFLKICDGNMQEGSFRCDVNLSLRPVGKKTLGTRTEIKNINSFRFIEKAIQYEQLRHQELLESGQSIRQETRLYNPDKNKTELMRSKEDENDYRYFPDPDLLPITINEAELKHLKSTLPRTPVEISRRLKTDLGLSDDQVEFLLTSPAVMEFFDAVQSHTSSPAKTIVNWLKGAYSAALNDMNQTFETPPIPAQKLATLLNRLYDNTLSNNTAKIVFNLLLSSNHSVDDIIQAQGFMAPQESSDLEALIRATIDKFPKQAAEYRAGKDKLLGFFVGHIMKESKGQADPTNIHQWLIKLL